MSEIDLESAIDEIICGCDDTTAQQSSGSPFFFIVGAGVSAPVICTARQLQDSCKEIALKRRPFDEPDSTDPMNCYSYWFEKAFPHPHQRATRLRTLMDSKPISPANLRLAHLLQSGTIANIVVTPNFDALLSRALHLFGASPIICDHPGTIRRLDAESSEIQILHVHGTYPFYDACNLGPEIDVRARPSTETTTVSSFLSHLLWKRSPIVIGYSGWERDVIMSALKARICDQVLPVNLYWFCYEHSTVSTLPDWLRTHNQVRFVIPEVGSTGARLELEPNPTLDAAHALERFISKTKAQLPALFRDPVGYFAETLEKEIYLPTKKPYPETDSRQDIYRLQHLVTRVQAAAKWLESPEGYAKTSPSDDLVGKVLDARRRVDPTAVVETAGSLLGRDLTPTQRHEVIDALMSSAVQLQDDPTTCIKACELVSRFTAGRKSCPACESAFIHACFLKGEALRKLGEYTEAILEFDRCVERAAASHDDVALCPVLADALYCKALSFSSLGQRNDEIATYEDLWKRCVNIPNRHLRQLLAKARTNIGMALQEQGLDSEALESFRQVIQEFGNDEFVEVSEPVAKSLVHVGLLLERGEDKTGALGAYDEVLQRFANLEHEGVYDPVAKALANKARLLSRMGETEHAKAKDAATAFIERFGNTTDVFLLPVVAAIHQIRGRLLGVEGDPSENM